MTSLIEKEIKNGIKSSNIVLAGFSQGACMSLTVGLRLNYRLGGIVALSGKAQKGFVENRL